MFTVIKRRDANRIFFVRGKLEIQMMYLQSAFTNSKSIVKISWLMFTVIKRRDANPIFFVKGKLRIQMMYLQSAFTNSKPIVKINKRAGKNTTWHVPM
jgi:hypothetical protein